MHRRLISYGLALAATVILAGPALAAKPPGPNPYPGTSQANCDGYGGVFTDFGGGVNECVVTTSTSATYDHAENQIGRGGGWIITQVINTTYTFDQGTREITGTSSVTCINPGGKTVANDWIHPCQPSSYPIAV